jgi:hypothetical protein
MNGKNRKGKKILWRSLLDLESGELETETEVVRAAKQLL